MRVDGRSISAGAEKERHERALELKFLFIKLNISEVFIVPASISVWFGRE